MCAAIIKVVTIISSVISHTRVRTKNKTPEEKNTQEGSTMLTIVPFIKFDIFNNVVQPRSLCGFSKYLPNMCITNQIAKFSISQIIRLIAGTVLIDV